MPVTSSPHPSGPHSSGLGPPLLGPRGDAALAGPVDGSITVAPFQQGMTPQGVNALGQPKNAEETCYAQLWRCACSCACCCSCGACGSCSHHLRRPEGPVQPEMEAYREGVVLQSDILINLPIKEVFDAVTTTRLWQLCYPDTASVGGATCRPFEPGDLILEKFLLGGFLWNEFDYQVDVHRPPTKENPTAMVRFTGTIVHSFTCGDLCLGECLDDMGGTFEYLLREVGESQTLWHRNLYLYHKGQTCTCSWCFFQAYTCCFYPSLLKGGELYLQTVKRFLDGRNWHRDLYMV